MTHPEPPAQEPAGQTRPTGYSDDAYRFGRRNIVAQNESANISHSIEPLGPEDFLNPQPEDEFNHGPEHARYVAYLAARLRHHYRYISQVVVIQGAVLRWPDPALDQPAPDLVLLNVADGDRAAADEQLFEIDLRAQPDESQRTAPPSRSVRALFEVTSPLFADLDLTTKREIYAAAGVPEYWIVDTGLRPDHPNVSFRILGYQLQDGRYAPIAPDDAGRLVSPSCRLWFQVAESGASFTVGDVRTGEAITPDEEDAASPSHAKTEANLRARSIADQLNL